MRDDANQKAATLKHEHEEWSDAALDAEPVIGRRGWLRLGWVAAAVVVLVLLVTLPPLVNVNRYQHRVAQGISDSIGRPVHFDDIHVHLLPLPGLTIQNFVVQEDPAFGTEPSMRANVVEARLRLASLWRRRIEVSHIELKAPSINLVRRDDGRWNLQGVVTQAGYLQSAPTAQGRAGDTPRFPYIEATDARVNVKQGETKLPWSLVDAKLALWLPEQNEWRVRVNGRPLRTDTDVSDVGELEIEGSLGRGAAGLMDQPLALSARWHSTPLGETTKLFLGRDTGFRGDASAEVEVRGTPGQMRLTSDLHLHNLRRAEFVPRLPMSVNAHCEADGASMLHQLQHVHCAIPTAQSGSLFDGVFRSREAAVISAPDVLAIQAEVPNALDPATATATADLQSGNPEYFLNWLRVFSSRIPESASASGKVTLHAVWHGDDAPHGWSMHAACVCGLTPAMAPGAEVALQSTAPEGTSGSEPDVPSGGAKPAAAWKIQLLRQPDGAGEASNAIAVMLQQAEAGSGEPAEVATADAGPELLHGQISQAGYTLQYASAQLAHYAALLLPPLGDDMPANLAGPVQSERVWQQQQVWTVATATAASAPQRRRHHR